MPSIKSLFAVTALVMSIPLAACSEDVATPSAEKTSQVGDTAQVEKIVREYLLKNPEVIIEAINEYQRKITATRDAKQKVKLSSMSDNLKHNPNDPVIGNPNGDVTVLEFFDYRCGFCKRVFPDVQKLLKSDGNIRYVLKEFPILGPESVYASHAAQAVWLNQPEKYLEFHTAMMLNKGSLGEGKVMKIAKSVGLDPVTLKEQMKDPLIEETINATAEQATALGISGTPAFIFGNKVAPGAISLSTMIDMVVAARKKNKEKGQIE